MKRSPHQAPRQALAAFSILERIDVGETQRLAVSVLTSKRTFSILERIDVGETTTTGYHTPEPRTLSVSSNGSTWVKLLARGGAGWRGALSVSSNGSTWVKPPPPPPPQAPPPPFSILERIDVGETQGQQPEGEGDFWLSVSSNGSTWVKLGLRPHSKSGRWDLSVSSNGSTWVKLGFRGVPGSAK